MMAHLDCQVSVAFFISPVVDMDKLNGVDLSDKYLRYVRSHPVERNVPTHILYGSEDHLVPFDAIEGFTKKHDATLTIMDGGEHWFHTDAQMHFLDKWIRRQLFIDKDYQQRGVLDVDAEHQLVGVQRLSGMALEAISYPVHCLHM